VRKCVYLVLGLSLLACSDRNTSRAVSEDFIYNYYQRADQAAALYLSAGPAAEKLEDEIKRLTEVRGPGQQIDQMPKITHELIGEEKKPTHMLFNYKLTIKTLGTTTHTRKVVIHTEQIEGRWKVINFNEY